MDELKSVLKRLAVLFNENQIPWALGASMMLYIKGIVSDVHDLDIMILEDDEQRVLDIVNKIGTIKKHIQNPNYVTKVFIEAIIEGVEVDIIGGFAIKTKDTVQYCPLQLDQREQYDLDGITVFLDSLKLWQQYYTLMGRHERALLIEKHIENK